MEIVKFNSILDPDVLRKVLTDRRLRKNKEWAAQQAERIRLKAQAKKERGPF